MSTLQQYERALANDYTLFLPRKAASLETPSEILTRDEYAKLATDDPAKFDPGKYDDYVEKRQAELAQKSLESAKDKSAGKTIKIRIVGRGWRPGQTTYTVIAKAPRDLRLQHGDEGYEKDWKPEPGIRVPIGVVVEIPLRNAAHRKALRDDPNIEVMPEDTMTHAEEERIKKEALERAKSGKGPEVSTGASNVDEVRKLRYVPAESEWKASGGRGVYAEYRDDRIKAITMLGMEPILGQEMTDEEKNAAAYVPSEKEWREAGYKGDYQKFKASRVDEVTKRGLDPYFAPEPKAEAAPKKSPDAPKPEEGNSAPKDEVQSEAPAAKGKAKK